MNNNKNIIDLMADINYTIIVSQQSYKGGDVITKKVGRPYSENPKEIRLTVRLDKKHNDILERYSNENGITKNESVRRGIEKLEDKETE